MFQWRVILLAVLAMLLLLAGLAVLALPVSYEGPVIHRFDQEHTVQALDLVGLGLLAAGCAVAWGAGLLWQRKMHAP